LIDFECVVAAPMASKCSSERNSCMSLILSQNIEMMMFIEEGMLKVENQFIEEDMRKLRLLPQLAES
jgi:hypothetical protein